MPTIPYTIFGTPGKDIIFGTENNDVISGNDGDDTIVASAGNDSINGEYGFDTADYSNFKFAVVLKPAGVLVDYFGNIIPTVIKGNLGEDRLGYFGLNTEKVIAPAKQLNTIDASDTPANGVLVVNLENKELSLTGVQNQLRDGELYPEVKLQFENFVNVIGTGQGDTITGDAANNNLNGGAGNDTLSGERGNDTLIGSSGNDLLIGGFGNDYLLGTDTTARGASERDTFYGGNGKDRIILGDATGAYYKAAGVNDLAIIHGISLQDNIVLSSKETYSIDRLKGNSLNLYVMQGSAKELIAQFAHAPRNIFKEIGTQPFQISAGQTLGIFTAV